MRIVRRLWRLFLWIILILTLNIGLVSIALSAGPDGSRQVKGLSSSAVECLALNGDSFNSASETVHLTWQGQVDKANIVLTVSGSEAAHSIKVNGQRVAETPIYPQGNTCQGGELFYLEIPSEVLVQGQNTVEISNDGLLSDAWSAANIRLNIVGDFVINIPAESSRSAQAAPGSPTVFTQTFTSSFDGSSQQFQGQIPSDYDSSHNTPTPLLIAVHPRSNTKEFGVDEFGIATDSRVWAHDASNTGWLLASPELHGRWPIPPECFNFPNTCTFDDKILAGTTSATATPKPGAYAHASLESQYDVIDTVRYMVDNYNVDPARIYLAGYSMGGQGGIISIAKFPHLFAALFDNKAPSNMVTWFDEQVAYFGTHNNTVMRATKKECYVDVSGTNTPAFPDSSYGSPTNPFCYERRSGIRFAGNLIHTPISVTHSISDNLVPFSHSTNLRDAVNGFDPDYTMSIYEAPAGPPSFCDDGGVYHCYTPDSNDVLDFLEQYTLNNTPTHINITTDESKSFYWMDVNQTGGDHWSQIEVWTSVATKTVTALISDTSQIELKFNLGSASMTDIIEQPGIGLPSTTYLIKEEGEAGTLEDYTSGYLTTNVASGSPRGLTISALDSNLTAAPIMVDAGPSVESMIEITVFDHVGNLVPDNTLVEFSTDHGTFVGSNQVNTTNGKASITLNLNDVLESATVQATVGLFTDTVTVKVNRLYIPVLLADAPTVSTAGDQPMVSTLTLTASDNFGVPVDGTEVIFTTDQGTWPNGLKVYTGTTIGGEASANLTLLASDELAQVSATIDGESDSTSVDVIHPAIDVSIMPSHALVSSGSNVLYSYIVTNTGDVTLTDLVLSDDNGTPGNISDDIDISGCADASFIPGEVQTCTREADVKSSITSTATALAKDALSNDVTNADSVEVRVITMTMSATPDAILADGIATSKISAIVTDDQAMPFPNGTVIKFKTDIGTLSSVTGTVKGGNGEATVDLTSATSGSLATVTGELDGVEGKTQVIMFASQAQIELQIMPNKTSISPGDSVTYEYVIANTGAFQLTNVTLLDDNGTPTDAGDNITSFDGCTLPATLDLGERITCTRTAILQSSTTNKAFANGSQQTSDSATATVTVISDESSLYLPLVVK